LKNTVGKEGLAAREGRLKRRGGDDQRIGILRKCYVYFAEWLEAHTRFSHLPSGRLFTGKVIA